MTDKQARVSRVEKPRVDLSYLSLVLLKHGISTTIKEQSKFAKWRMHFGDRFRKKIIDDYTFGEFTVDRKYMGLYSVVSGHYRDNRYYQRLTVLFEIGIEKYMPIIPSTDGTQDYSRMMSHIVKVNIDELEGRYEVKREDIRTTGLSTPNCKPIIPLEWMVANVTADMLIE